MNVGDTLLLNGPEAQRALGAELAARLPRGGVLFLEGDLGSGKTTLTQGLLAALGFPGEVQSPTYALMSRLPTPQGEVLHVDAYRVRHPDELRRMDLDALVEDARLTVMEWGAPYYDEYAEGWIVRLEHLPEGEGRRATRVR